MSYIADDGLLRLEVGDLVTPLETNINAVTESVGEELDSSVRIWPVANTTERDALGTGTPLKPLYAHRADTGNLERNTGTGWEIVDQWKPGKAFAEAADVITMEGTGTKVVNLPANRFTVPPLITINGVSGQQSPSQDARAYNVTTTQFTVLYQRADDWSASHTGARDFAWRAVQMTPTTAAG